MKSSKASTKSETSPESTGAATPRRATKPRTTRPRFPKAVSTAIDAALDKLALDVVVLDLRKADGFTDFFVICTGANPRQVGAISDGVRDALRKAGERPAVAEGTSASTWVLLDYFNFVVHVFSRECRAFYDLERLWGNAVRHEIPPAGVAAEP